MKSSGSSHELAEYAGNQTLTPTEETVLRLKVMNNDALKKEFSQLCAEETRIDGLIQNVCVS
jgi:hypothetical protein